MTETYTETLHECDEIKDFNREYARDLVIVSETVVRGKKTSVLFGILSDDFGDRELAGEEPYDLIEINNCPYCAKGL